MGTESRKQSISSAPCERLVAMKSCREVFLLGCGNNLHLLQKPNALVPHAVSDRPCPSPSSSTTPSDWLWLTNSTRETSWTRCCGSWR